MSFALSFAPTFALASAFLPLVLPLLSAGTPAACMDTGDNGVTFELHIDEVEVQLDYIVANTGQYALTALTGEVSILTIASGAVVRDSTAAAGLPVALRPRTQTVIQSSTEIIQLTGRSGDIIAYNFNVDAQTGNQFALPCVDQTSRIFDL